MSCAFDSVDAMLNGKKYPYNVRALRILAEVLLRPIFQPDCKDFLPPSLISQLFEWLSELCDQSSTVREKPGLTWSSIRFS